jgi:phosphonate transport system substrate-binding protein
MDKRQFLKCSIGALTFPLTQTVRAASAKPLRLAVFPRRNASVTYSMFMPFTRYLARSLERDVQLEIFKDFTSFWEEFQQKQFDIVHFNQYHYILARHQFGYQAIARNLEFGSSTIAGSIIVRNDSGIEAVSDLKGKNILFGGGPRAMQSYIAPVWLLQQAGLEKGDYKERFAINPPNAVISTYLRRADAAGTGDVIIRLEMVKKIIDVGAMQYLARTEPMAHLPWAVNPAIDSDLKQQMQQAMLVLKDTPAGQDILDSIRLSGLVKAEDSDYTIIEKMVRDVYGDDLGISKLG